MTSMYPEHPPGLDIISDREILMLLAQISEAQIDSWDERQFKNPQFEGSSVEPLYAEACRHAGFAMESLILYWRGYRRAYNLGGAGRHLQRATEFESVLVPDSTRTFAKALEELGNLVDKLHTYQQAGEAVGLGDQPDAGNSVTVL